MNALWLFAVALLAPFARADDAGLRPVLAAEKESLRAEEASLKELEKELHQAERFGQGNLNRVASIVTVMTGSGALTLGIGRMAALPARGLTTASHLSHLATARQRCGTLTTVGLALIAAGFTWNCIAQQLEKTDIDAARARTVRKAVSDRYAAIERRQRKISEIEARLDAGEAVPEAPPHIE